MLRIATAAVLLPLLWIMIRLAPIPLFVGVAAGVIALACWECYGVLWSAGARPFRWLGLAATVALVWSFSGIPPAFEPVLPLVLVTISAPVLALARRDDPAAMREAAMTTVMPMLFVGLSMAYLVRLRTVPGEDGRDLLMLVFVCAIFSDTAAFAVGKLIGRHRLAPCVSPNKTWEGALGGMAASLLGALLAHFWFYKQLALPHALVLGLLLGLAAILGDLAESALKRAAGVKDSSRLLPGHGGMLDRTDSLLFCGPILYYYYIALVRDAT